MADLTPELLRRFLPQDFEFGSTRVASSSGFSGLNVNEQIVDIPYSHRWLITATLPPLDQFSQRADVEGALDQWFDPANRLLIGHYAHPVPYGSMRGNPTLIGAHAQGVKSLTIQTVASATVLRGDVLGVTTTAAFAVQLVRAAANATANGSGELTLSITTNLRAAANANASVIWSRPAGLFRPTDYSALRARFSARFAAPVQLSLKEVIS